VGLTVGAVLMATRNEQVRTGDVLLLVGVLMAGLAGVGVLAAWPMWRRGRSGTLTERAWRGRCAAAS